MKLITVYFGNMQNEDIDKVVSMEEKAYNAILQQCDGVGEWSSDTCIISSVQGQCYYGRVNVDLCPDKLKLPDEIINYEIKEEE